MRFNLLTGLIAAVAAGIVWLCAGRYLTMLVDRFLTVRVASIEVHHLQYDGGGLRIGEFPATLSLTFGTIDNQPFDVTLRTDTSNLVILSSRGRDFTLGPRTNPSDPSGKPDIYFSPGSGDSTAVHGNAQHPGLAHSIRVLHSVAYSVVETLCLLPAALEKAIWRGTGDALAL